MKIVFRSLITCIGVLTIESGCKTSGDSKMIESQSAQKQLSDAKQRPQASFPSMDQISKDKISLAMRHANSKKFECLGQLPIFEEQIKDKNGSVFDIYTVEQSTCPGSGQKDEFKMALNYSHPQAKLFHFYLRSLNHTRVGAMFKDTVISAQGDIMPILDQLSDMAKPNNRPLLAIGDGALLAKFDQKILVAKLSKMSDVVNDFNARGVDLKSYFSDPSPDQKSLSVYSVLLSGH
jgi:hypothetical protein